MTTEVTVVIGSEVSAAVPLNPINCCLATSTVDVGWIQEIINYLLSWI